MLDLFRGMSSSNSELNWNTLRGLVRSNCTGQPRAAVPAFSTLWRRCLGYLSNTGSTRYRCPATMCDSGSISGCSA
jgi:hypothetical protein